MKAEFRAYQMTSEGPALRGHHRRRIAAWVITLVVTGSLATSALAQHGDGGEHGHGFHRHHVSVFGGGTYNIDVEETFGTVGADYVYRAAGGRWGFGIVGEVIFAEETEWLFGYPLYFYLTPELWLRAGPGVEFVQEEREQEGHDGEAAGASEAGGRKTEQEPNFLLRLGVGYAIDLGQGFSSTSSAIIGRSSSASRSAKGSRRCRSPFQGPPLVTECVFRR